MKGTETHDVVSNLVEVKQPIGGGVQSPAWASLTSVDIGLAVGINTDSEPVALVSGACHISSSNPDALRLLV